MVVPGTRCKVEPRGTGPSQITTQRLVLVYTEGKGWFVAPGTRYGCDHALGATSTEQQ